MKRLIGLVAMALLSVAMALPGCCENKALREGMLRYSDALEQMGIWAKDYPVDPRAAGTVNGQFDRARCIEAAKYQDLVQQGAPVMALTLKQWAQDKDVTVPARVPVNYEEICR